VRSSGTTTGLGLLLDVSRMALNPSKLEALTPAFSEAFAADCGSWKPERIANPDEQRRGGH